MMSRDSVLVSNSVLPDPGLETRFATKTPARAKSARMARANSSFFLRIFARTSSTRGVIIGKLHRDNF